MISYKHPGNDSARANKMFVLTKNSQDGRSLEGFWIDFEINSDNSYPNFLFLSVLDSSEMVENYSVFDKNGKRMDVVQKQFGYPTKQF